MDRLPQARRIGKRLRNILHDYLIDNPSCKQQCVDALESKSKSGHTKSSLKAYGPSDDHVSTIRTLLCTDLGWNPVTDDIKALEDVCTELYFPLWRAWVAASGDPDVHVPRWFREGAPAGIDAHPELCGVFPQVDAKKGKAAMDRDFVTYHEGYRNYTSVEADGASIAELNKWVASSFVHVFSSRRAVKRYLRSEPILSKLAMITERDSRQ